MDSAQGRAIYGNGPPSTPKEFSAKEEPPQGLLAKELLESGIKDIRVISSLGERLLYSRDQSEIPRFMKTILFRSMPEIVVQARTPEAVAAVLKFASSRNLTVVPRGSASSPFGGAVPVVGGLVLDVSCMDKILAVDAEGLTATVLGGARWADLDNELERYGLCVATSPSSKFSTVGGWIATGGLGVNSYSRGHLSKNVLSIELATPNGKLRSFSKADVAFSSIFGSEGQLGVITKVTLAVKKRPEKSRPHLVIFEDAKSALGFANALSVSDVLPVHILFESASRLTLTNRVLGQARFRSGDAVLVSIEGPESEERLNAFLKKQGIAEEREYLARYLWGERFFPMKVRKYGPGMLGSELLMPVELLPQALESASSLMKSLEREPLFEVHFLPEGQALLLSFFTIDQANTLAYTIAAFESLLLSRLLIDKGGRPYSIGIWNNSFLDAEDKQRVGKLRKLKSITDPAGIMNSGKYFVLSGRFGRLGGLVFHPRLMRPILRLVIAFSPLSSKALAYASEFARKRLEPEGRTEVLKTADECAMCGACVSVCPAYLVVKDERVTARGKLLTAKAMAEGKSITKEHAHRIFLCMRCKACEQVCQSKLELMPVYDKLEKQLEEMFGKDTQEIDSFVKFAESLPEYDSLVERGLVLGAPKHGMGGSG